MHRLSRRVRMIGIALTALVLSVLTAPVAPARDTTPAVNAVVEWNQHANDALLAAGQPPHVYLLHMAMVHGAVYDAVNAVDGGYQPYLGAPTARSWYSQDAAAASAAYRVLVSLLPEQQPTLELKYLASLGSISDGPSKDGGVATGEAAATAMLTAREGDGRFGAPGFPVGSAPGEWRPVPPAFLNDPNAWVADVKPFLIRSASEFRSEGPDPLDSSRYAKDFAEVKSLGSLTSTTRTHDQTAAVLFWGAGHPPAMWSSMFRSLALGEDLSTPDDARLFAMLYLTGADAAISCWDDKRYWGFWRPITAIQAADTDGNRRTDADPTWQPLLPTPPYPDHPSAHTCISGSFVYTLQDFFGTNKMSFGTQNPVNGIRRDFTAFSHAIEEIIDARVWAGLHFRTADEQGATIGNRVAHWRDHHYFRPTNR